MIMTVLEEFEYAIEKIIERHEESAFQRGVERGKFEQRLENNYDRNRIDYLQKNARVVALNNVSTIWDFEDDITLRKYLDNVMDD